MTDKKTISPVIKQEGITVYEGDCGLIMPGLLQAGTKFDLIVTDPPWMLHAYLEAVRETGRVSLEAESEWFKKMWGWTAAWMHNISLLGIDRGWIFSGTAQFALFIRLATLMEIKVQHVLPNPGHEYLVYYGPEPLHWESLQNATRAFNTRPYSNRKDPKLLQSLIEATDLPRGSLIIDPFMGEGGTMLAAIDSGHQAIGIEMRPEYIQSLRDKLAARVKA